jgi:hypothetical protein
VRKTTMSQVRALTPAEFESVWLPLRRRIFSDPLPCELLDTPFERRPDWKYVPVPQEPIYVINRVYYPEGTEERYDDYVPLVAALHSLGESEICVSGGYELPAFKEFCLPVDRQAIFDLRRLFPGPSYAMFGRTGKWGLAATLDHVSYIGGEPEFMAAFLDHAGGIDTVRKRFEDYHTSGTWSLSYEECYLPAVEEFYAQFGWTNPVRSW